MKTQSECQSSIIRQLAKSAKQRLKNSNYRGQDVNVRSNVTQFVRPKVSLTNNNIIIKTIDCNEDQEFCKKVHHLLGQEEIINPLSYLLDKEYMNSLNDFERQRYIFELSEKYNKVKETYINNQIMLTSY